MTEHGYSDGLVEHLKTLELSCGRDDSPAAKMAAVLLGMVDALLRLDQQKAERKMQVFVWVTERKEAVSSMHGPLTDLTKELKTIHHALKSIECSHPIRQGILSLLDEAFDLFPLENSANEKKVKVYHDMLGCELLV
jgi:hypothetical protein